MKIFVCYKSWDYEGCSPPIEAFLNEEEAKEWCELNKTSFFQNADYEELEIK